MHVIFVDKARTDKPVVLTFRFDQVRVHHQPTLKLAFVECIKAYRYGKADENDSNVHEYRIENFRSAMLVNLMRGISRLSIYFLCGKNPMDQTNK